jgi:hypothetical protein
MRDTRISGLKQIFDTVCENGSLTRLRIAEKTGISSMTVGKAVDALTESRLLAETKSSASTHGRKAGIVSLNPDAFFAVFDITSECYTYSLVSLPLNCFEKIRYYVNPESLPEENMHIFLSTAAERYSKYDFSKCLGVYIITLDGKTKHNTTAELIAKRFADKRLMSGCLYGLSATEILSRQEGFASDTLGMIYMNKQGGKLILSHSGAVIKSTIISDSKDIKCGSESACDIIAGARAVSELVKPAAALASAAISVVNPTKIILYSADIPIDEHFARAVKLILPCEAPNDCEISTSEKADYAIIAAAREFRTAVASEKLKL